MMRHIWITLGGSNGAHQEWNQDEEACLLQLMDNHPQFSELYVAVKERLGK